MHPFTGLATREDGAILACCRSHPIGYIQDDTLENIWNNDTMKHIRKQVLNDERPSQCEPCFVLEDQGVESLRQRHITNVIPESRINLYPNILDNLKQDYSMPFEMPAIEIKLNNLCNLKCRMCHPMDSTSWNDWNAVEEFYIKENNYMVQAIKDLNLLRKPYLDKFADNDNWWKSFEKLLPYFKRVEFAGGEPLMDPQHYKILDMLSVYGDKIEIKYATNLTMLGTKNRNIYDYWHKFRSVAVNVSIDGIGDSYEYIRTNADYHILIENIKHVQKIPNVSRIVGSVAVQVSNVLILDKMIEYFLDDLGIVFYTNMVKYPNVLSIQVLPEPLKQLSIERLRTVRDKVSTFKYVKLFPILKNITYTQIDGIINFLESNDQSHLWDDCIRYNTNLDLSRNSKSFFEVTKEFILYR
jgi:molybdenum cofactor biosynthesis enzyme MoaA